MAPSRDGARPRARTWAPVGAVFAMWVTGTPFSVSSGIGFIVLFGVSVLTGVVYISCANELRLGGMDKLQAAHEAAVLRLRPILMTALVAALGLLMPALYKLVARDGDRLQV